MSDKITLTFDELVAVYQSWYDEYIQDPSKFVECDAKDYNGNYALSSATQILKHIKLVQGEKA